MDNKFIDTCRLLGNYNSQNVYVCNSAKYEAPRIFYSKLLLFTKMGIC